MNKPIEPSVRRGKTWRAIRCAPLIVGTLLALGACGPTATPETEAPPADHPSAKTSTTETGAGQRHEPPESSPGSPEGDTTTPAAPDFSIREAVDAWASEDKAEIPAGEDRQLLPDLFDDTREKRVSTSGRVLTRDEAQSLTDSVDGFEVELEVKTN